MKASYYKPSGKFDLSSFIYFLLLCAIVFPLWGAIYAYAIWYIPLIYINFIITAVFAFGIGFAISTIVIEKGKVRNVPLAIVFALLGASAALYFHWAVWVDLAINAGEVYGNSRIGVAVSNIKLVEALNLALNPSVLFDYIKEINEYGTWGLRGNTVSGIFLSIVWIIEFLAVVVIAIITGFPKSKMPFCERDNAWFGEMELPAFNFIENPQQFVEDLERGNVAVLDSLENVANPKEESHSVLSLYSSEAGEHYLSVENKFAKIEKKGKVEFKEDTFVEYIGISQAFKDDLLGKVTS